MSDWKQYDSEESIFVLRKIANKDAGESRTALLEAARDSRQFVPFIRDLVESNGGKIFPGNECPDMEKMDEGCFKNMSWKIQGRALWDSMKDMSPIVACRPGLWLYMNLHAIENNVIESHFLAAFSNGHSLTGLDRIDEALKSGDTMSTEHLAVGRQILRRMFGVISIRGAKALFTDIPLAKVWWQRRIAEEISEGGVNISADEMANFFAEKGYMSVYDNLIMRMSGNLTAIADKRIRDGLMHFFFNAAKRGKLPPGFEATTDNFKKLTKRLGIVLAWRGMGAMSALENSAIAYECAAEIGRGEFS